MATWTEITLTTGETYSRRERSASEITPEAIAHFARLIRDNPDGWQKPLAPGLAIDLHVTIDRDGGGAVATFSDRLGPLVTVAYLIGDDPEADRDFAGHVQRDLIYPTHRRHGVEAGFDLTRETARPLVAAVIIPRPPGRPEDYGIIGDAESCLAAAFFAAMEAPE